MRGAGHRRTARGFSGGWVGRPPSARACLPQPAPTCLLSCRVSASSQPPPHSPTSPLKKHPQTGPAPGASSLPHGPHPHSIQAAPGPGCREEVPARLCVCMWGWGGSPGPGAPSRGLPRSGPEASSYGRTREGSGQRGTGSPGGRRAGGGVSGRGAFGMHFAPGHPRPLPPALWGHWDGTKPSATNQRPPWSPSPEP